MLLICNISSKILAVHHFVNSEEDYYIHTQLSLSTLAPFHFSRKNQMIKSNIRNIFCRMLIKIMIHGRLILLCKNEWDFSDEVLPISWSDV